mmetsp:Transcript_28461/g.48662  ORF Transcript_28461/g.48662 Transcript_28461/m.48662 type:complete len:85 (-) Transcript_28461:118-372(-)
MYFDDAPGHEERLVCVEAYYGVVEHYEGAAGEEQRVRRETPEGDVYHWAGEPGVEALVRVERATGEVSVIALFPRYPVMLSCDI